MRIEKFEAFSENLNEKKKKKKDADKTSSYPPPKYLVEPAENETGTSKPDKGFFMLKAEFDKRKKRFDTGVFY